jgi:hypothetical protein
VSKQVFALVHTEARRRALHAVAAAPDGYIVRVSEPTRSLEQNALLWSRLNDIAEQVEWHGRMLDAESWKHIFSASLKKQDAVQGLDGGFVVLGISTSRMNKRELSDLIELIHAFGAERDVQWTLDEVTT